MSELSSSSRESEYQNLLAVLKEHGQEHIAECMTDASHPFVDQLRKVSVPAALDHFRAAMGSEKKVQSTYEPVSANVNVGTMWATEPVSGLLAA